MAMIDNHAKKMIRNLVFDMGNVLLRFEPDTFLDHLSVTDETDRELLLKYIYHSPDWSRLDTGEWNEDDLEAAVRQVLPERLYAVIHQLIFHWDEPIMPVEGMADLLKRCKERGCRIYLLSNASRRQHEYWDRVPGHEYFNDTLISADVLMVKPDLSIFHHLLEKHDLKPEETLFIDDVEKNTQAASQVGINVFLFKGDAKDLEDFLF